MDRYDESSNSISRRDIVLLVVAILAGILTFVLSLVLSETMIDKYMESTWLSMDEEKQYIDSLQDYIWEKDMSFAGSQAIEGWVNENPEIAILMYDHDNKIVRYYMENSKSVKSRMKYREELNIYSVNFIDSSHDVSVIRTDDSKLYYIASSLSCVIGVAFFLTVIFALTYRREKYIVRLKEEMDLIAVGNLNCEITVKGNDELANLAQNLNQMRKSLLGHIEEEERLAHDIRTPLTSIMLYAEILKNKKYDSQEQGEHCIEGIRSGAEKISKITDQLMRHMRNEQEASSASPQTNNQIMGEYITKLVRETADSLKLCGFETEENFDGLSRIDKSLTVTEVGELTILRVLENIRSNIIRYADASYPVEILCRAEDNKIVAEFKNVIKAVQEDSTEQNSCGIGLKSVNSLMKSLGGSHETLQEGKFFMIRLIMPFELK